MPTTTPDIYFSNFWPVLLHGNLYTFYRMCACSRIAYFKEDNGSPTYLLVGKCLSFPERVKHIKSRNFFTFVTAISLLTSAPSSDSLMPSGRACHSDSCWLLYDSNVYCLLILRGERIKREALADGYVSPPYGFLLFCFLLPLVK